MTDAPRPMPQIAPRLIFVAVALPMFLAIVNQTMISVALPPIGAELGELARLPWLVIGYMLALTVTGPAYGALGDTLGRKTMLMMSLGVYLAGTIVASLAPSFEVLALGRLIQGMGGGGLISLSQALIGQGISARERGRMQGYVASIGVLASTSGPIIGGVLVETLGWRSLFLSTVPLALIGLVLLARLEVRQQQRSARGFDWSGFLFLNLMVVGLTLGMELMRGFAPPVLIWLAMIAALAGLLGLMLTEGRAVNPLFPPALVANPAIWRAILLAAFHGATVVSYATFLPLFLRIVHGKEVLDAAAMLLAITLALGLSGFVTGHLISRLGRTALFPTLGLVAVTLSIAVVGLFGAALPMPLLWAMFVVTGLGLGTVMPVVQTTVQQSAPDTMRGAAAGSVTFGRSIGSVVGAAAVSMVVFSTAAGPGQSPEQASAILARPELIDAAAAELWARAFAAAFLTIAGFSFAGWLTALTTPARRI